MRLIQGTQQAMTSAWQKPVRDAADPALWRDLGDRLRDILDPSIRQEGLIEDYYLPLYFYLSQTLDRAERRPLLTGINGPQGSGKSTLTSYLVRLFEVCGLKAVTLSVDDFYLTHEDQLQIAAAHADNDYLQQRGYPGTHDIQLGLEILERIKAHPSSGRLALPRYDKSRHRGRGDRTDKASWPETELPVDIVLLEGWMLGFQPLPVQRINDGQLLEINELLGHYRDWHRLLDSFIYLYPEDPGYTVDWRIEAEERMKANGLPGMPAQEVRTYAEKFLPAYHLYGRHLLENPPTPQSVLTIRIGRNRLPVTSG